MKQKRRTQNRTYNRTYNRGNGRRRKRYHGQGLFSAVMLCCLLLFAYGFLVTEGYWTQQPGHNAAGESGGNGVISSAEDSAPNSPGNSPIELDDGTMEVHFIDVGQGDATLVKCAGETLLIDAGDESKGTAIQYYLMKQGIDRLDYLVLTHPDSDHIGSADVVLTKFEVGNVIMSDYAKENTGYRNLLDALEYKGLTPQIAQVGQSFTVGEALCTVLGPVREYEEPNNASVILLIEHGENRFLFTGDAEGAAETDLMAYYLTQASALQADVYKAGHHGSRTSSTETFLDAVNPAYAVISCAEGNDYGHPHAEVLERFQERAVQVYRTDEQGSVVAVSDGVGITWE